MAADITALVIEVKSTGIKEASQALSGLGTSAANAERKINNLIEATKKLNTLNETAAKSFVNVADKMREQDKLLSNMAANSRVSARGVQDLAAAMTLLSTSLNLMNQNLVRVEANNRKNNEAMKEAHALARGLSGSFGALWLTYGNLAGMSIGVTIGAGLKSIISIGGDVENTLEGIRIRAGESQESMNKVAEAVERIGKGVYGPQEVAKAFETLALAGLKARDSTQAIGAALNLAIAGGTSIEKAAESLVTIGTAVGATAKEYDMLADGITTAANTSLASVDSIAEAVKRASVVNKLYGASFDDILTQTAALAQLGIKNTSAGTAIVNFYNNSLGQTEKSRKALDALGMSFTDLNGRAKPVVEAFEEFTEKLNKFDLKSQQRIINDIFGERALRDVEALRDLVNTSADDTAKYSNRLREIQGEIAQAAGTSALQAAMLGQTTSKQMESVGNTLKVSLSSAFTEISPVIREVSDRLKEVFSSPEFIRMIANVASGIADITAALVENYKAVVFVADAFLLWKSATVGAAFFTTLATAITGVATAMGVATTATTAFGTALRLLPGIGAVLSAVTAAIYLMSLATADARDRAIETAEAYNKDFLKALDDEATRLDKINELTEKGASAKDAQAIATREVALAKLMEVNADAVAAAQAARDKAKQALDDKVSSTPSAFANIKPEKETKALAAAQENLNSALDTYSRTMSDALTKVQQIEQSSKRQKENYLKEAEERGKAAQDLAGKLAFGGPKVDTAAINDQYAATIAKITADIKAAKKDIQNYDDALNDKFKAGEIGKLQVIKDSTANQLAEYDKIGKKLQEQIDIASKGKNKKADVERFTGLQDANTEAIEQAKRKAAQETSVYIGKLREDSNREQVKQFEAEGRYLDAATLRWSTEYAPAIQAVQKDFEKYGDTIPEIGQRLTQLKETEDAFVRSAALKEFTESLNVSMLDLANTIKGVQTANEDQGLAKMFEAAQAATDKYKASLPALQAEIAKLKDFASSPDASASDKKAYQDALSQQKSLAEKYKTMWTGVGKSISDSLSNAFGKSGKAAGGMIEAITEYQNTDNKSIDAKIKLYGNAADSAKGFFEEGSKGYKIMDTVSKAFHAAELARTIAGMAPKIASGVASLFAQGGWAGFAGAAAFLALMAGLGFSGGGSAPASAADRQKANGTGSVLGDSDAKSESIQKSLDIVARNSDLGLVHFNSMDKSLRTLVTGISGLSSLLVRGTNLTAPTMATQYGTNTASSLVTGILKVADATFSIVDKITGGLSTKITSAIFGGKTSVEDVGLKIGKDSLSGILNSGANVQQYTDIKKSGGLFRSDKYTTQTQGLGQEVNNQFSMIITSLADTVKAAGSILGYNSTEFEKRLNTFVIDIGEISTKGLTGDEIQKALETAFSKLGDDMAKFAIVGLDKFQKVGEGYLETVARVTNELVQVRDVFEVLGKTLNATGVTAIEISQNLIEAFGSVESLTESTKYFIDNFLTEVERAAPVQASLEKELARLGLSAKLSTEEYKKLVLAQDLNSKSGQEMYAALLNLAPAFKTVQDAAEALKESQNKAVEDARSALQSEYNNQADTLQTAIDKLKTFTSSLTTFIASLKTGSLSTLTPLQKLAETKAAYEDTLKKAREGDATAQGSLTNVAQAYLQASQIVNASSDAYTQANLQVQSDLSNLAAVVGLQQTEAQLQLDALNKQVDGLINLNTTAKSIEELIRNLGDAMITAGMISKSEFELIHGSHAGGLEEVPFDNYRAKLHKGEAVVDAQAMSAMRRYFGAGGDINRTDSEQVVALKEEIADLKDTVEQMGIMIAKAVIESSAASAKQVVDGVCNATDKQIYESKNRPVISGR